jgi:hypothetical protein
VFLLDYGGPEILRLDATDHSVVRRFGGSGAGPGELRVPLGLAIRGDTIVTTNVGNGRFEFFSTIGDPLPSRPAPAGALVGRLSLTPDGGFSLPTNGSDSSLARLFHPDGRPANGVGAPIVAHDPSFDLGAFRAATLRGEVPSYYRNGVLAALAPDSVVWLALNTEPAVMRFGPGGQLLGRSDLSDPAFPSIRQWNVERNRDDSTGRRVYPLLYFADLKPEGGRLWALLNMPPDEAALVVRIGASGGVERWFRIAGATSVWRLAVRPSTRELLLTSAESASLFRVHVPLAHWASIGAH